MRYSELYHYGIKGMKWGVRRFQNTDGTYTSLGKSRRNYKSSIKKVNEVFSTLSPTDRYHMVDDKNATKYEDSRPDLVKYRSFAYDKNKNARGFIELSQGGDGDYKRWLNVVISVSPELRGTGTSKKLVEKGKQWFEKHADDFDYITWGAHNDNIASNKLAEKSGFKKDKKQYGDDYTVYTYSHKGG